MSIRVKVIARKGVRTSHHYPSEADLVYETNKSIQVMDDAGKVYVLPKSTHRIKRIKEDD